jgi:hypothetical protein
VALVVVDLCLLAKLQRQPQEGVTAAAALVVVLAQFMPVQISSHRLKTEPVQVLCLTLQI